MHEFITQFILLKVINFSKSVIKQNIFLTKQCFVLNITSFTYWNLCSPNNTLLQFFSQGKKSVIIPIWTLKTTLTKSINTWELQTFNTFLIRVFYTVLFLRWEYSTSDTILFSFSTSKNFYPFCLLSLSSSPSIFFHYHYL